MNFFRSILADDTDPPESRNSGNSGVDSTPLVSETTDGNVPLDRTDNAWSFGGMFKDLAARSESVIETYRKDLEEFRSGLKKETEIIRVVASRAVKDLPVSLEAGASAAHGVLDGVLKSTAEIISREMGSDGESGTPGTNSGMNWGRYSRFEAQLSALQSDLNTFCGDPDDLEEFENWRLKFQLKEKRDEIDYLTAERGTLDGMYKKVVPSVVDRETFWCRYFYRVDKLKQQEKIRANLVKRAMSGDDDDDAELSWDVDDEEDGRGIQQEDVVKMKTNAEDGNSSVTDGSLNLAEKQNSASNEKLDRVEDETVGGGNIGVRVADEKSSLPDGQSHSNEKLREEKEESTVLKDDHDKNEMVVSSEIAATLDHGGRNEAVDSRDNSGGNKIALKDKIEGESLVKKEESDNVSEEKRVQEMESEEQHKNENIEALDVKGVVKDDSSHEEKEETDELSWDEIEDVASDEEKKNSVAKHGLTADMAVLRKQLTSNEDDEDLSWDIEDDDDQPVKS